MNNKILAFIAAFIATTIYGLNHTIAKEVMPGYIGPFGFIMLRVLGASILFWIASFFFKKEKIAKQDYPRIAFAALVGMCLNMLMFFKGLQLSTPINSGVIVTITPIIILILSSLFLRERITFLKLLGIFLGFSGAILLVIYGNKTLVINAPNIPLGNLMLLTNAISFGAYLVIVKPLSRKYKTITLMKWMFIIGLLYTFPITFLNLKRFHGIRCHLMQFGG